MISETRVFFDHQQSTVIQDDCINEKKSHLCPEIAGNTEP